MADANEQELVVRNERGHFLTGGPGGPGRPRGLTQSEKVRALLEPHREELIGRALALTTNADPFAAANALRICLERLAPAPKQEPEKIVVPGLADAVSVEDKARAIIAAVGSGDISAESGERCLRMIDVLARAVKIGEIERRLAAIEQGKILDAKVIDDARDLV
jgi:hypothetical protein